MFEVVGQDIISGNMGFIGTDPDRLYRMGAAEKTEDVTVTGNPAVLDNATGKPFKDLHIYGRSEQMTTTGAQILKLVDREPVTICGLTWQIKNQCISVNGTATDEGNVTDFYICGDRSVYADVDFPEGGITISADLPKDIVMYVVKNSGTVLTYITSQNKDGSFEHISGNKYRIMFRATKKGAICDNVIKAMFNRGDVALPWEPYTGGKPSPSPDYPQEIQSAGDNGNLSVIVKNPDNEQMQSVSFSTPNGLPGILVSAGGNYTDETGQQWICDEVDLGREVYVQRVKVIHIDITRYTQSENGGSHWYVRYEIYDSMLNSRGQKAFESIMCTTMQVVPQNKETAYSYPIVAPYGHADRVELRFRAPKNLYTTIQDFQDIITGAEIRYPLATPIETPLTADEIAAYKSLRTYRGTTIVEAEDKAGISVTYKRHAKTDNISAEKK
nr:MAG TPA: hypothetical protein [Caudoviricetes sp.]